MLSELNKMQCELKTQWARILLLPVNFLVVIFPSQIENED